MGMNGLDHLTNGDLLVRKLKLSQHQGKRDVEEVATMELTEGGSLC